MTEPATEQKRDRLEQPERSIRDYLKIDPPIPGQNWAVLSFLSPEDMIVKRNLFYINRFLVHDINKTLKAQSVHAAKLVNSLFVKRYQETLNTLSRSVNDVDKMVYNRLKAIHDEIVIDEETVAAECLHEYALDAEEIADRFSIYQSEFQVETDEIFNSQNGSQTSIRGLKVRGTYNTREEADERAKFVNETVEPNIHAYVAQVGFWLPWDPNPDTVKESHYQNQELNKLMGQYQENVQARNKFFEERKQEMAGDGADPRAAAKERLKKKLRERKSERCKK